MNDSFSHVPNFTKYMTLVYQIVNRRRDKQHILDIPAGNGLLAARLKEDGHDVVCADINEAREDFVFADMSKTLPFEDGQFDTVMCLEGVEHMLNPTGLISELCRVTKPGGRILLSLPNVQNLYSRFQFLCTGTLYQFAPALPLTRHDKPEMVDLGHVSSISYVQLRYLFQYHGADILSVSGDRYKKKWLLPFLLPFTLVGAIWVRCMSRTGFNQTVIDPKRRLLFSLPLLCSRSLILEFQKEG